jgi:hypothetical protein
VSHDRSHDVLRGGPGGDRLVTAGTGGHDKVLGGTGNDLASLRDGDTAVLGDGDDWVGVSVKHPIARIDAGPGRDQLFVLGSYSTDLTIRVNLGAGTLRIGSGLASLTGVEDAEVVAGRFIVRGTGAANVLCAGNEGRYELHGGAGDDLLIRPRWAADTGAEGDTGIGPTTLDGGPGDDTGGYTDDSGTTTLISIEHTYSTGNTTYETCPLPPTTP